MLAPAEFVNRCTECIARGGSPEDIAGIVRDALVSQREQSDLWGKSELLHCSDELMIVDLELPRFATSAIHDHCTWAVIGISAGRELDAFFVEDKGTLRPLRNIEVSAGETLILAPDCIHFIANPCASPSRGIHVYGKNLALTSRRMWDPQTCTPRPMDFAVFEQWEGLLTARSASAGSIVAPRHA